MKKQPLQYSAPSKEQDWLLTLIKQQQATIRELKLQAEAAKMENQQLKTEVNRLLSQLKVLETTLPLTSSNAKHAKQLKSYQKAPGSLETQPNQGIFKF